jgi:ABC-type polysaccharide/polyol phosphate export permease
MIINLYRHRGYIWQTALADLRTRYAGSVMGVVWNVLQPLAMILVFSIVFGGLMTGRNARVGDLPGGFAVFLCAALLPWLAFNEIVARGTNTFVTKAAYLRKLPIPEQVFMAQTAVSSLIGLAISFGLLVAVALALGGRPSWTWLLLPIPLVLIMAFGFGIAMALGTINVFIRDTAQIVPIVLRVAFWTYPVVYPIDAVPAWFQRAIRFNPIYAYLESTRDLFLWGKTPHAWIWAAMVFWAAIASAIGYLILRRLRPELRDVI